MFKPMLAPNDTVNLEEIKYPLLASVKMDGIRCIFKNGEILSRSLKQIQNKQLREKFEPLRKYSEANNVILDGEIFSPKLTFQEITHFVMTQDLGDELVPESLKFYCFDMVSEVNLDVPFASRIENVKHIATRYNRCNVPPFCDDKVWVHVDQTLVSNKEEVVELFAKALEMGQEGLILRDPNGKYKTGRGTVKEGLIYKVKPFETFDAKVTAVIQATEVREGAEKKTNELGRSVTSKKKDDRVLIEKASAFEVMYNGLPLKVTLAMTDEEKEYTWGNKHNFIGRTIEYKGMLVGAKDLPRHPVFLRFRTDKD